MKAIQIKFMGATDTLPSRLKAWAEGGVHRIEALNYDEDISVQAERLARKLGQDYAWPDVTGFGTLPNGDWVATL